MENLSLVVVDDRGDVVLNYGREGGSVVDVLHPLRQLRVPEKRVATNELSVLLGKADDLVGVGEVELSS